MNEQINYENNIPEVGVESYDAEPIDFECEDERKGFPWVKLIVGGAIVAGSAVAAGKVVVPKIMVGLKKKKQQKSIKDLEKDGFKVIPPVEEIEEEFVEDSSVNEEQ